MVITRPVQAEIDSFKSRGNTRLGQRSRAISAQIREMLEAEDGSLIIRQQPFVKLVLRHDLKRLESLSEDLDYSERDDQLIGTAAGFKDKHPEFEVRLLTNDTGPMASAGVVGLPFQAIPENWVMPAEPDESDRRTKKLQAELEKYKQSEPNFSIDVGVQKIDAKSMAYMPLTDDEVSDLMQKLVSRHPKIENFGPSEMEKLVQSNTAFLAMQWQMVGFVPPSQQIIDTYFEDYEKWLQECKLKLERISVILTAISDWPRVRLNIDNQGSRPAEDALIVIEVDGPFQLMAALPGENLNDVSMLKDVSTSLPVVPKAPKGKWEDTSAISRLAAQINSLSLPTKIRDLPSLRPTWMSNNVPLDPDAFFFSEGAAGKLSKRIQISCKQWRHARDCVDIELMLISLPAEVGEFTGRLNITVHASNLTVPSNKNVPIRLNVSHESCYAQALGLIKSS